jgi:hypothetical protein
MDMNFTERARTDLSKFLATYKGQELTQTQKTSGQILVKIASGVDPIEALKAVCGVENVERMIVELVNA